MKKKNAELLELEDIKGVGDTTAAKMRSAGINSPMELVASNAEDVALAIRSTKDVAIEYMMEADKLLRKNDAIEQLFRSAKETEEKRKGMIKLTTGSKKLDEFLLGGIETQSLTEIYGEFGSGKSQICHVLAINSTLPVAEGGLDTGCIYIDTEGTFRPERIREICNYRKIDADATLEKIKHAKPLSAASLELLSRDITTYIQKYKVKLVIVDSVIALHRSDYLGRGNLGERQNKLSLIVRKLLKVADIFNMAVVVTNQVVANPAIQYGDPLVATGGNVIGHLFTYRMRIDKVKQSVTDRTRKVRWIDSPYHPIMECMIDVTGKGIEDHESTKSDFNFSTKGK